VNLNHRVSEEPFSRRLVAQASTACGETLATLCDQRQASPTLSIRKPTPTGHEPEHRAARFTGARQRALRPTRAMGREQVERAEQAMRDHRLEPRRVVCVQAGVERGR
jgi:hypothetical protein